MVSCAFRYVEVKSIIYVEVKSRDNKHFKTTRWEMYQIQLKIKEDRVKFKLNLIKCIIEVVISK